MPVETREGRPRSMRGGEAEAGKIDPGRGVLLRSHPSEQDAVIKSPLRRVRGGLSCARASYINPCAERHFTRLQIPRVLLSGLPDSACCGEWRRSGHDQSEGRSGWEVRGAAIGLAPASPWRAADGTVPLRRPGMPATPCRGLLPAVGAGPPLALGRPVSPGTPVCQPPWSPSPRRSAGPQGGTGLST